MNAAEVIPTAAAGSYAMVVLGLGRTVRVKVLADLQHRGPRTIVLGTGTELDDRLCCFELGAVDYLAKPIWIEELIARVRVWLGRSRLPHRVLRYDRLAIDLDAQAVALDEAAVKLTPTELALLVYLAQRAGQAIARRRLADEVLIENPDPRTVDAHVTRLRKKLGTAGEHIATVWGVGYRFDGVTATSAGRAS